MNINCVICSDVFSPSSEVYVTTCGHMFHYVCLINWIERSKTCPQCRFKSTEKNIHRVYFNLANTDHIVDDAATLQCKIDNLQFQLKLKEKDVKNFTDKYQAIKTKNALLINEVAEAENENRLKKTVIHALQEQVKYFKAKVKENDLISGELMQLKQEIKKYENIQLAITGTRDEVKNMLESEKNVESLVILAATLKKTLLEAEKKKRALEQKSKHLWNEITSKRQECERLQLENVHLKDEISTNKKQWDEEKTYLKNKLSAMAKKSSQSSDLLPSPSLQRIVMESPAPLHRKADVGSHSPSAKDLNDSKTLNLCKSLTVDEAVQGIMDSDSPYLPIKQSNVGITHPSLLNTKYSMKLVDSSKYSIFKKTPLNIENVKISKPVESQAYNGLGGTSKVDLFPTPKTKSQCGVKRKHRSSTSISSKFKKLAPQTNLHFKS